MAIIATDSQHYKDIAEAIREKLGNTSLYKPTEMADAIRSITGGGEVYPDPTYVVGAPAEQSLTWDAVSEGTTKMLLLYGYKLGSYGIQIGLPNKSSDVNTQEVIQSALTIADIYTFSATKDMPERVKLYLSAIKAPTRTIKVAFFGLEEADPVPVNSKAISGVTVPATGKVPVSKITENYQYSGTVEWSPVVTDVFAANTVYTATITLTPKHGFTFTGVSANLFTVSGASSVSNAANSGVVTAVFPATGAAEEATA